MFHKHRGNRRDVTKEKALRKVRIVHSLNDYWSYPEFGYYRKGKIHCGCPRCAAKTNSALNRSQGPVDQLRADDGRKHAHSCRLSCTNKRYGKKAYKPSDRKKVDRLTYGEEEFAKAV